MQLFTETNTVGIFRGFSEGGLEFHADLVLPYKNEFQSIPMHGQFLIVQLEDEDEAVLGRITSVSSSGRLASPSGEDYGIRAVSEDRIIPEDLREQYLKYKVNIRVLGLLRSKGRGLIFAASHRRLPHVGSKVAFLSDEVLREVTDHNIDDGAELGFFALGEFVYSEDDDRVKKEPWMKIQSPSVIPKFHIDSLVSRRTLVFARAGFGKSNLVKLLLAKLYNGTPVIEKRGGRTAPVGTVIFDPEGEYFWPDDKGRPALCDVPELEDKLVVFTPKAGPSDYYQSFVAGGIKLDIRRLRPSEVISIALSPEKQDQQNVRKLKGMNDNDWRKLVNIVYRDGNAADGHTIKSLMRLEDHQDAEMVAARANMTTITRMLHDPSSQMMDMLIRSLSSGKICIVDVSQMRGTPALTLSGLVLRKIFKHNQSEFTKANPETIPVIAVVEEAQVVLGSKGSSGEGPYVSWVKEGRKYDLGAVLITQQPGSISSEILSQGDNWFVFHLLSAGDLQSIKKANAHFSSDILSSILNEPIPGNGVFWSSASGKSYPIPVRILSFENLYSTRDPDYNSDRVDTAATVLREEFDKVLAEHRVTPGEGVTAEGPGEEEPIDREYEFEESDKEDVLETYIQSAIDSLCDDNALVEKIRARGMPYKGVIVALESRLPSQMTDRNEIAYDNVPRAMDRLFGEGKWDTEKRPSKSKPGKHTTWIVTT